MPQSGVPREHPRLGPGLASPSRRALRRLANGIDATNILTAGSVTSALLAAGAVGEQWVKVTASFSDFATAGATNTITIYIAPAGSVITAMKMKHSAAFLGGTIASYTISAHAPNIGIASSPVDIVASNVHGAPGSAIFTIGTGFASQDQASSGSVTATATSTGGFLNTATQGSVDFWILISTTS